VPGSYDDSIKKLIDANPQDFVSLVFGNGYFVRTLPHELKLLHLYADALFRVMLDGEPVLLHIEFQSGYDPRMQERFLEYNTLASREYGYLPIYSCVIHLKKDSSIPVSPFMRKLPTGEEVVRFHYKSVELWKKDAIELLHSGWMGLLPLVPLTRGGTEHGVVEEMIAGLVSAGKTELLVVANALASLAFEQESEAEQEWLERRFAMLNDTLRNTRAYQKILKEGREEGLEKGRQEALQQALLDVVEEHFPQIMNMATQQVKAIGDPATLRHLIVKMTTVQTAEDAEQLFRAAIEDKERA
jgi:predicted transposase YdaD